MNKATDRLGLNETHVMILRVDEIVLIENVVLGYRITGKASIVSQNDNEHTS